MILERIFTSSLIYATIRSATPIIYAALCASITQQADILNIGTEGIMLVGAFAAVAVSYLTGSWVLAVGVAMLAGLVMGLIIAVGHIRYKADNCASASTCLPWRSPNSCSTACWGSPARLRTRTSRASRRPPLAFSRATNF